MPVSIDKAILFARAMEGKQVHLWPVAVFNHASQAKSYAGMLKVAYKSGSADAIKALDPSHHKTPEGEPLTDIRWSIVTVPYSPSPAFGEDDEVKVGELTTS